MIKTKDDRIIGYDIIRIIACVMVVLMHTTAEWWYSLPVSENEWAFIHILNALTRAAVPLFFMISGALFLSLKTLDMKRIWRHNILRILIIYVIWNLLYAVDTLSLDVAVQSPMLVLETALTGKYHLWFLTAMAGIYVILPVLYALAHYKDGEYLKYYIFMFFIFGIVMSTLCDFSIFSATVSKLAVKLDPELMSCSGYFILGYYLSLIKKKPKKLPLVLCFFGAVSIAAAAGIMVSRKIGAASDFMCSDFMITTFIEAVCVFMIFAGAKQKSEGGSRLTANASACTLGIYLLHPFLIEHLSGYPDAWGVSPVPAAVAVAAVAFTVSLLVSALIRRIPIVGRYLM